MLVKIATTNDTNGNPRRGWLRLTAGGQVLGWIEEGYLGRGAIEGYDDAESPTIYVSAKEYKRFKNWGQTIQAAAPEEKHLINFFSQRKKEQNV
jgi:hypothetical protein